MGEHETKTQNPSTRAHPKAKRLSKPGAALTASVGEWRSLFVCALKRRARAIRLAWLTAYRPAHGHALARLRLANSSAPLTSAQSAASTTVRPQVPRSVSVGTSTEDARPDGRA